MAAASSAPKRLPIDVRVAASPVVALRFHLDARVADLDSHAVDVERELIEATASRANLIGQLRRNEEARRRALADSNQTPPRVLVRALHDGLAITHDLGRQEARVAALKRRLDDVAAERATLRTVLETLMHLAPEAAATDERAGKLSQASRSIYQLVDEEHEQLAHSILDGPMQRLADAGFEAELAERHATVDVAAAAEHARRCRMETVAAADGLERVTTRLHPISARRSLVRALRDMLQQSPARDRVQLRVMGIEQRLSQLSEIAVFRIVEEAVENAARHGHSEHIDVVVSFHQDRVVLVVKDDGEGFDVVATEARLGRTRGLGLIEMHERAALVGSRLEVRSLIGVGTEVRATLQKSR